MDRLCIVLALMSLTAVAAHALDGRVHDESGAPIEMAQICYQDGSKLLDCVTTDAQGRFSLAYSEQTQIMVLADGYHAVRRPVAEIRGAIVLSRSPILLVTVVDDATGEPIEKGEVIVLYPTGEQRGPFPLNASGVRIRRVLQEGLVLVRGMVPGYAQKRAYPVTLSSGVESKVEVRLTRSNP